VDDPELEMYGVSDASTVPKGKEVVTYRVKRLCYRLLALLSLSRFRPGLHLWTGRIGSRKQAIALWFFGRLRTAKPRGQNFWKLRSRLNSA